MSAINGDKSRFHRARKAKIARRKRQRELLHIVASPAKMSSPGKDSAAKPVSL
ncbi:MAG: hypothetical protein H0X25_01890 [Acidobacteriales bacterium]|nr:hypothetical protein [Terriglobales bacterium]